MSPTDWLDVLYELAIIAFFVALLLYVALSLALRDVEPGRSRDARRWGGVGAGLFTLAFGAIGRYVHIPQGLAREVFDFLAVTGVVFGFPFGVLLWYLLRGRGHTEGSSNSHWRGP